MSDLRSGFSFLSLISEVREYHLCRVSRRKMAEWELEVIKFEQQTASRGPTNPFKV